MRSLSLSTVLLATLGLVSAQAPGSISEAIEQAERGVGWVALPYGIQYPTGILFPGYTGWITLPLNGGPPCKSSSAQDTVGQC
ncbi:hypothetical protein BZA05DRAFT_444089 [Tricharina praecox]|uniref:uncharacterized protein n=1 Tax=Tricharina praecox TaxID=43433 RepID=UPI002220BE5C|nr:uncharacterized protein BZA05DRAFT_444089 [Tricharina praecox]KAI5853806.1 hypothetical protein BZA05DRAFT_444089 [Tricharina praecox]